MFRNPRENNSDSIVIPLKPSVGRPPSPPLTPNAKPRSPPSAPEAMETRTQSRVLAATPPSSRTSSLRAVNNATPIKRSAGKQKPNASILSFFKKEEPTLFIGSRNSSLLTSTYALTEYDSESLGHKVRDESQSRFNEDQQASKRRKTSSSDIEMIVHDDGPPSVTDDSQDSKSHTPPEQNGTSSVNEKKQTSQRAHGPFLDDSDSEAELDIPQPMPLNECTATEEISKEEPVDLETNPDESRLGHGEGHERKPASLTRADTSLAGGDGFEDFEGVEDFEDEYMDGEEFSERRWMREQRRLELAEAGLVDEIDDDFLDNNDMDGDRKVSAPPTASTACCPICSVELSGVSEQDASIHVNNCLDGNPTPLPTALKHDPIIDVKEEPTDESKPRIQRPARPGQSDPFATSDLQPGSASAFSRLMSGHAEDAAWASAAAAEHAARGKPSYQRTCPFYKILPGFNICVDAFRYGAVKGCKAYFLSHFHSDHYVGLTASWCHGPIYCSRATANLVRQQLRVDPKWVVDLEFESEFEVPGSNGVRVTTIPANHCPGSAIYLFEKTIGQGKNPTLQRVLHCGDFRACPAHVEHPLLRPDVTDLISGKTYRQKIDVCYLDTTYLNPRYAFPSQEDVIKACADMCVSLSKAKTDSTDAWETMKRDRAGSGMVKFVNQATELETVDQVEAITTNTDEPTEKSRGRLLVVVGTYSIGKERICLGIARALKSKIYAPPNKQRICAALEDPELNSFLTNDPSEAQVHMTPLFEIRAETLGEYLDEFKGHFSRAVAFRPSGWNYRPPNSRFTESPAVSTVLHSDNWKSGFSMRDLVPQRGSTSRTNCFGVPYSEHSSFRELTMFCCALRIDRIIPTVNVGSAKSRERMKTWCERWSMEKKKNGLFRLQTGTGKSTWYAGDGTMELRTKL